MRNHSSVDWRVFLFSHSCGHKGGWPDSQLVPLLFLDSESPRKESSQPISTSLITIKHNHTLKVSLYWFLNVGSSRPAGTAIAWLSSGHVFIRVSYPRKVILKCNMCFNEDGARQRWVRAWKFAARNLYFWSPLKGSLKDCGLWSS